MHSQTPRPIPRLRAIAAAWPLLLAAQLTASEPVLAGITGTVIHGERLVIDGSSFGTRPDFNLAIREWRTQRHLIAGFKDFEDGSTSSGGWSSSSGHLENMTISAGGPANSGGYLASSALTSRLSTYGFSQVGNDRASIFTSFWYMQANVTAGGKMWRWYFGPDSSNDNLYLGTSASGSLAQLVLAGDYMAQNHPALRSLYGAPFATGVWRKVEVYASKPDNAYVVWMDGVEYLNIADRSTTMWSHPHTMDPNGHTVEIPSMNALEAGAIYNYDDIYIDHTRARVEIGSGSTWATRGVCNTQIPLRWDAESIEILVNTGTFATGEARYLYVVADDGSVNAHGWPVTIGRGPVVPPPGTGGQEAEGDDGGACGIGGSAALALGFGLLLARRRR